MRPILSRTPGRVPARQWHRAVRAPSGRKIARQHEGNFLAFGDLEVSDRAHIFAFELDRRVEQQPVRPGDELKPSIVAARNPGDARTILEADDQFRAHGDLAANAAHEAH